MFEKAKRPKKLILIINDDHVTLFMSDFNTDYCIWSQMKF